MFDPLTVAWEIKSPFKKKTSFGDYREPIITIWHKDPCKDGSDNSCDIWGSKKPLDKHMKKVADWVWDMETVFDNRPHFPDSYQHKRFQELKEIVREAKKSKWRVIAWRFHFWHYRLQIHPYQALTRFLFARCSKCGKGFKWKDGDVYGTWGGKDIWHGTCNELTRNKD